MLANENEHMPSCPRCGSIRVKARQTRFFFTAGMVLIGIFFVSVFIIPPLGVGSILVGFAFLLFAPFAKDIYQCQSCKKIWRNRTRRS